MVSLEILGCEDLADGSSVLSFEIACGAERRACSATEPELAARNFDGAELVSHLTAEEWIECECAGMAAFDAREITRLATRGV